MIRILANAIITPLAASNRIRTQLSSSRDLEADAEMGSAPAHIVLNRDISIVCDEAFGSTLQQELRDNQE